MEGGGAGFERSVIPGDADGDLQGVSADHRVGALAAVAGNEGDGDFFGGEPIEKVAAAGVEGGFFGGELFMSEEKELGLAAARFFQQCEGFENGAVADAHVGLDAGEIEHWLGEGAVHVEEDGAGEIDFDGFGHVRARV